MINKILEKYKINNYELYGPIAKIDSINQFGKAKKILVTATNPTKYGEGKTTVVIGLNDALNKLNKKSIAGLREPSMGPVFGIKGGATGGGKAKIIPENNINLHFTGDMHAITTANNLICAVIDNEIYQGNSLGISVVTFKRCLDQNDRALRNVTIDGRKDHFEITAASEIMAILCLAKDFDDLRRRLDKIIFGYKENGEPLYVSDLKITDALLAILNDAFRPNAVNSLEENLALVHGGPFANIAHGCSSLSSLMTASNYADYIVTEAGFGSDMGGFKFFDIVSRDNFNELDAIVIVTTVRALRHNGNGVLENGISNLECHITNMLNINKNVIVTLNKFDDDTIDDINYIKTFVDNFNVPFVVNTVYQDGGEGALKLAEEILTKESLPINYLYNLNDSLEEKINVVLKNIMHADGYEASEDVKEKIKKFNQYSYPICIAKTQYSISDNAKVLGYPKNYKVTITDIDVKNGAEFIIIYLGNIITMPGLNKDPNCKHFITDNSNIIIPN